MAQDLGVDHGAGPSFTDLASDIADGATSALFPSTAIDLATPSPLEVGMEWTGDSTSASSTGPAFLYAHWSHDNSDFPDVGNGELIATMTMNGTTKAYVITSFKVRARYLKFTIENQSGGSSYDASESGNVVFDLYGDQA